jgi:hypothetical protein
MTSQTKEHRSRRVVYYSTRRDGGQKVQFANSLSPKGCFRKNLFDQKYKIRRRLQFCTLLFAIAAVRAHGQIRRDGDLCCPQPPPRTPTANHSRRMYVGPKIRRLRSDPRGPAPRPLPPAAVDAESHNRFGDHYAP